jgi:hypothetical protein
MSIHQASTKSENHKKSAAGIKKHTIPFVSFSIIGSFSHGNTQALGKELYPAKISESQG